MNKNQSSQSTDIMQLGSGIVTFGDREVKAKVLLILSNKEADRSVQHSPLTVCAMALEKENLKRNLW